MGVILKCEECPFNGQDNIYCRTCTIPLREELRQLSDVHKLVVNGVICYSLSPSCVGFG